MRKIEWKAEYENMSDAAVWADAFTVDELTQGVHSQNKRLAQQCRAALKVKTR